MMTKVPVESENHLPNRKYGDYNEAKDCVGHMTRKPLCSHQLFPKATPLRLGISLLLAIALGGVLSSCGSAENDEPYRTIDGSGNNLKDPKMNQAGVQLIRLADPPDYTDEISSLAGMNRPNPRDISNIVTAQDRPIPNPKSASDFLWLWGQFLDHDISLTPTVEPPEPENIPIPVGDPFFDPDRTDAREMMFNRSVYDPETGMSNPRQQLNEITGWIDASNIYGSTEERATVLRLDDGSGKLLMSAGSLLAFNEFGLPNDRGIGPEFFVSGDERANEHIGLMAMHTIFAREHNRLAEIIAAESDTPLSDEEIYQMARRIVGAQMQIITYNEFLPALLGPNAVESSSSGYDSSIDAGITNIFSTAAYRFGHSVLSSFILRLDAQGNEIAAGHVPLREAFFAPQKLIESGLEPILRGFAAQVCQKVDAFFVDDIRNFLFGAPGDGGFDLVALNIQRGRDHGLPNYNETRKILGLAQGGNFSEVTESPELQDKLADVHENVDTVDVYIGGLAEDPLPGSMLGELFHTIVTLQFEALRDGDRFWYQHTLSQDELRKMEGEGTRLADIIRRNTDIGDEISDNVFIVEQVN